MYVFPGGRVDRRDAIRAALSELREDVAARVEARASRARARALAVACVRETHEETGLAIGELAGGSLRPALRELEYVGRAITPPRNPIRYHARFFHTELSPRLEVSLASNGELLDLEWHAFDAALELPMLDVTAFLLRVVARRVGHPAGDDPEVAPGPKTPFIHYRGEARVISYE
jgi:8-oxo-dGTP pyrophosphatase MutT (NUDIX family)